MAPSPHGICPLASFACRLRRWCCRCSCSTCSVSLAASSPEEKSASVNRTDMTKEPATKTLAVASGFLVTLVLLSTIFTESGAATADLQNATEDWPMLGGDPQRNFYRSYTIKPPLILKWKYTTGALPESFYIESSPAIYDQSVIVGGKDGILRALNIQDGRELWTFHAQGPIRSSPPVFDGNVFVGSDDGSVYAVNANTGKLIWQFGTEAQ